MRTGIFNWLTPDNVGQMFFNLGYTAHGGSGLGYNRDVVRRMPIAECLDALRRLEDQRDAEAKAIARASRVKR